MLILSRMIDEEIVIDSDIVVKVVEIRGNKVRLGITAPRSVAVHRREVFDVIQQSRAPLPQDNPRTQE